MPSYSTSLKLELMDNGSNSTTWGTVTNTNLGTTLEQAIVGKADITMSSTTISLSLTDSNAAQNARAIYLNLTGSPGGAAVLEVPAVQKPYIVKNGSDQQVTIKVTGLTGVVIPVGKTVLVYNNGTDVVTSVDHIPSLTLGAALPVASGGTGITSFGTGVATALGQNVTGSGGIVLATSPALTTPNLGTPSAATLTNATGLPIDGGTTGTLPVNRGGTGATTLTGVLKGNGTSSVTASNVNLASEVTGTLPIANGGTGSTTDSGARTNLGLGSIATQAANNVAITGGSISGITDLAVADGGTGASDAGTARTNLGLGSIATQAANNVSITGGSISGITDLAVADGGTGASDAGTARTNLDVPSRSGSGASGTWGINISGNAATVTNGITTSNIGSYAPGLTGSGASGTWGINISGNAATASNGGVTSVNSQTGAVVTTSLNAIGSVIWGAVNTSSALVPGDTVSGSNVYYPTSYASSSGDPLTYYSEYSGGGTTYTAWATQGANPLNSVIRVVPGSSGTYSAPQGTVSTLSGTWRVMSPVPARNTAVIDSYTFSYTYFALCVRVS